MKAQTVKPKKEYREFSDGKYEFYASSDDVEAAKLFIKKHGGEFKGVKVAKSRVNPKEWDVWVKV